MFKRLLVAAGLASAVLATAASAQAAFLTLGTGNPSNKTTSLSGTSTGSELKVTDSSSAASVFSLYGILGTASPGSGSAAVRGQNNGTGASGSGVWGSHAGAGAGVYGTSKSGNGLQGVSTSGIGTTGLHSSNTGVAPGIQGTSNSTQSAAFGLSGVLSASSAGEDSAAVYGYNHSCCAAWDRYGVEGFGPTGVYGLSAISNGRGVIGQADAGPNSYGVYGLSSNGYAGYFQGQVQVTGYMQLASTAGMPPSADCDSVGETGRMKVDATALRLYICAGAGGWKYANMN